MTKEKVMNILVLNADFQPLNVTTFRRAFTLVYRGKAEIVEYDEENPVETDRIKYKRPLIIRMVRYVYIPFKKVPLGKNNIFRRDGHTCMYCPSKVNLTLDHVIPKSRGGGNSWENLVTCCKKCNSKKDNKTPDEAGMKLRFEPYKPTFQQFIVGITGKTDRKYFK
jgi:5-methylcytosine-specific restriction endonuclease McrA